MRIIKNVIAAIKGAFKSSYFIFKKRCSMDSGARVFSGASLSVGKKASAQIGKKFKMDSGAVISVLFNGKLTLGNNVAIGRNNMIVCHDEIRIGDGTILAPNVFIYDHDHVFDAESGVDRKKYKTAPIVIGKNCWIGANTVVLKGTVIGDNCVIGAGSVVKGVYNSGSVIIQKRETVVKEVSR